MVVAKRWRNRCDSGTPDVGTVEICGTGDVLSLSPVLARVKSCRRHSKMKSCNHRTCRTWPGWTVHILCCSLARVPGKCLLLLFTFLDLCNFLCLCAIRTVEAFELVLSISWMRTSSEPAKHLPYLWRQDFWVRPRLFFFLVCFERRNPEKTYKNYSENCRGCLFIKLPGRRASFAPNVVEQHLAKVAIFPSLSDLAPRFSEVLCFFQCSHVVINKVTNPFGYRAAEASGQCAP